MDRAVIDDLSWREIAVGALSIAASAISLYVRGRFAVVDKKLDELMESMRERDAETKGSRQEIIDKLDRTVQQTHETAVRLSRIEGRLERD